MNGNTKTQLIRAAFILGGVTALVLITRAIINKAKEARIKAAAALLAQEINGEQGENEVEQQQASSWNSSSALKTFEDKIVGVNIRAYPVEIASLFNSLTNSQLIVLNTAYKNKHNGESLHAALGDEFPNFRDCGGFGNLMGYCYKVPMARLSSLGLR
tara:strand:- start:2891 stop:3364 length:474 start_codon:yes stop_codon:yes gene_type:complete